jgi:ribosomal protein L29
MKFKEFAQMSEKDREKKLKDLQFELVKSLTGTKAGTKTKSIKKMIARIRTLNKPVKAGELKKT